MRNKKATLPILLFFAILFAGAARLPAAELRMEGERLTLKAEREPIASVLNAFVRNGVRVKLDPEVSGTITVDARREKVDSVLRRLMAGCDYVALWRQVPGPLGPIPTLEELQVYRPGHKDAVQPLQAPASPRIIRREYAAGELLLRAAAGISPSDFLALIARYGGRVADSLPALGIYKIAFPPEADIPALAGELARQKEIASAEPNYIYRLPAGVEQPAGSVSFPTPGAVAGTVPPGARPLVAVLDTGFNMDDPLISWLDGLGQSGDPVDLQGHGTQMALLAAGRLQPLDASSQNKNSLLPVLSVRLTGEGSMVAGDTLMRSLQAAIDQNVRVISLCWGSDMDSAYLKDLLEKATAKGIVVVAAAGNEPSGNPVYPAAFPGILAVGGSKPDGKPASWSNYGPFVDLTAPGYAPLPAEPGEARRVAVGTSVSTAYTAHVLGQYFQLHPEATTAQALGALNKAVENKGTSAWDTRYGSGLLDAAAVSRFLAP
jgi:hypothetical protein